MSYNNNVDRTYVTHGMGVMTMMNKKILTTTIALVAALGLAGCSTSATSTSQVSGHEPQAAKVAKATSHKASKKSTNSNKNEKGSEATNSTATFESAKASSQGSSTASLKAASAATTATSATKSSQATATKNDEQVLNQFMAQSGVKAEEGNQYMVTNQGNGQYQIEVRNSDGDQNISHLSGLYHYNTNTNHVSQMNVTTGQFN